MSEAATPSSSDRAPQPGRKLTSDALWLMAGHVGMAAGGLAAVRIMTTILDPDTYGTVDILVSLTTLALGLTNPFVQAAMRFLPETLAAGGSARHMRAVTRRWCVRILTGTTLALAIGGIVAGNTLHEPPFVGVILALLLTFDTWRVYETSLLNAARRPRPMILWRVCEAWARPLGALGVIALIGSGAWEALAGYAFAGLVVNALFAVTVPMEGEASSSDHPADEAAADALSTRIRTYAVPLIPTVLINLLNGFGDRYLIAGFLSVADAGLFVAIYAIASRPFLALGGFLEALLRPVLYNAVSAGHTVKARKTLALWLAAVLSLGSVGVLLTLMAGDLIVRLLLGEAFRGAVDLMPWIAAGYVLRLCAQALSRVLHAHFRTDLDLIVSLVTFVASVSGTIAGIVLFGLVGAAAAVPLYFGVQFILTLCFVLRLNRAASPNM